MIYNDYIPLKKLVTIARIALVVGCCFFLFEEISERPTVDYSQLISYFPLLVFSSLLNWGFEILKWKLLVQTETRIDFKEATQQCLIAHTASVVTPNKIGEYGAKAYFFKNTKPKKILFLNFIGNSYQMLVTTLFGSLGILYSASLWSLFSIDTKWFGLLAVIFVVLLLVTYKMGWLRKGKAQFKNIARNTHIAIFSISLLRYLLFSSQFLLLLALLGNTADVAHTYPLIWILYLCSSIIPSFALVEFTVKGSLAVFIFSSLQISTASIVATTFLMWFLNYALPAVLGIFYTLHYKSINRYGTAID